MIVVFGVGWGFNMGFSDVGVGVFGLCFGLI